MLDEIKNIRLLRKLIKNKEFKLVVNEPINDLAINFMDEFSKELKKLRITFNYPDLVYLVFWCRKQKITDLKKTLHPNENRLGRGLIFHICPSNIPTNFIYSFFFSLLSGNSNIVKMPSQDSEQKKTILKVLNVLFKKKKYIDIKKSNAFIEYDYLTDTKFTKEISSICDGRVVWGSDKTINEIRKFWFPERSIDLMFSDRYSLSVINLDKVIGLNKDRLRMLANKFYYDSYSMNQRGCNSPHFLFWTGKKNKDIQDKFWSALNEIIENKYDFKEIQAVEKYTKLIENILERNDINKIHTKKNNIYILDYKDKNKVIENIRGVNGMFYQLHIKDLNQLSEYVSKKCQTMSYFGFQKNELKRFILNNNLKGIDRVVPIGEALDIDFTWDGFDLIKTLSRTVSIK